MYRAGIAEDGAVRPKVHSVAHAVTRGIAETIASTICYRKPVQRQTAKTDTLATPTPTSITRNHKTALAPSQT